MPHIATARDVILQILKEANGEWDGKVKLHKAFYFAHLFYAQQHSGVLTKSAIAWLEHGPGILNDYELIDQLKDDGLLTFETIFDGPYPETRYRLTDKGKELAVEIEQERRAAINKAAEFCKNQTASELSRLTHERSRSWRAGKEGDVLNIYIDIIEDREYEKRKHQLEGLNAALAGILGDPREKRS